MLAAGIRRGHAPTFRGWIGWLVASIPLLLSCEGEHREYDGSAFARSAAGAGGQASPSTPLAIDRSVAGLEPETASKPEIATLANGSPCRSAADCSSGNCEAGVTGVQVCCALACSAFQRGCSTDGDDCVACEGDATSCVGGTSRACVDGQLVERPCDNGCDAASQRCNPLRPTGSLCDDSPQCESGSCTLDASGTRRCCTPGCEASGRVCGADGECVCPDGREDVAGVCRLPLGEACSGAVDCATGFCAGTLSAGTVCCAQSCAGAFCTPDGSRCVQCEGSGSTCEGNVSARCENGALIRTPCNNGCSATTGVCNGLLPSGQACTTSGQCATNFCGPDLGGVQRCCTPNCAASGRVCGADGSCVCANPNDVFTGSGCGCPAGTKSCGDGRCLQNNQCCDTCSGGRVCQAGNCACPNGQQFVNGQCRLNLGASCSATGTPCVTGLCVDGVCCESACDGLCMQCQAGSGRCVMPSDDAACPTRIACPAPSNVCLQTADITTNRCQTIGQCKTSANCGVTNRPARTSCGQETIGACGGPGADGCTISQVCQNGNCVAPTIRCAGVNRAISAGGCCEYPFPANSGAVSEAFLTDPARCSPAGSGAITGFCDTEDDCPNGTVCCLTYGGNFNSIACKTSCFTNPAAFDGTIDGIVCRSPGNPTTACPSGLVCTANPSFPGWSVCR